MGKKTFIKDLDELLIFLYGQKTIYEMAKENNELRNRVYFTNCEIDSNNILNFTLAYIVDGKTISSNRINLENNINYTFERIKLPIKLSKKCIDEIKAKKYLNEVND